MMCDLQLFVDLVGFRSALKSSPVQDQFAEPLRSRPHPAWRLATAQVVVKFIHPTTLCEVDARLLLKTLHLLPVSPSIKVIFSDL